MEGMVWSVPGTSSYLLVDYINFLNLISFLNIFQLINKASFDSVILKTPLDFNF